VSTSFIPHLINSGARLCAKRCKPLKFWVFKLLRLVLREKVMPMGGLTARGKMIA
jgi:hypothetical protein